MWVLLSLLLLVSCAGNPIEQRARELGKEIESNHDLYTIRKNGAYVADEIFSPEKQDPFTREICGRPLGSMTEAEKVDCKVKRLNAFASQLEEAYPYASQREIHRQCATEPWDCADPQKFETLWIRSQNEHIERSREDRLQRLQEWKTRALEGATPPPEPPTRPEPTR